MTETMNLLSFGFGSTWWVWMILFIGSIMLCVASSFGYYRKEPEKIIEEPKVTPGKKLGAFFFGRSGGGLAMSFLILALTFTIMMVSIILRTISFALEINKNPF